MDKQGIIQMAREAGIDVRERLIDVGVFPEILQRFATMAYQRGVRDEREACAKVCESIYTNGDAAEGWLYIAADKIRDRNNKDGKP